MPIVPDLAPLICSPDVRVSDALARIDRASPNLFQVVVKDGRVLGTITDGDIRRAILKGHSLSDPVDTCMFKTPKLGRIGQDEVNRVLLGRARFLPVIGDDGRLDHILVEPRAASPIKRALVMAGGFGRRLGELTRETPKPLLPVAGRPILDRVLEQIEASGVPAIHISLHFKADQIRDFIAQRNNVAKVSFIEESEPLGTAGALGRLVEPLNDAVLIVNGDVLTDVDFSVMHDFHVRHGFDGTIAVLLHETEVPFGVVRQTPDGMFAGIEEKPRYSNFVAAGLYYLSPEFVALTPRNRPIDMPELLNIGTKAGLKIGLFPVHEYWRDVGRPADLASAHVERQGK